MGRATPRSWWGAPPSSGSPRWRSRTWAGSTASSARTPRRSGWGCRWWWAPSSRSPASCRAGRRAGAARARPRGLREPVPARHPRPLRRGLGGGAGAAREGRGDRAARGGGRAGQGALRALPRRGRRRGGPAPGRLRPAAGAGGGAPPGGGRGGEGARGPLRRAAPRACRWRSRTTRTPMPARRQRAAGRPHLRPARDHRRAGGPAALPERRADAEGAGGDGPAVERLPRGARDRGGHRRCVPLPAGRDPGGAPAPAGV